MWTYFFKKNGSIYIGGEILFFPFLFFILCCLAKKEMLIAQLGTVVPSGQSFSVLKEKKRKKKRKEKKKNNKAYINITVNIYSLICDPTELC